MLAACRSAGGVGPIAEESVSAYIYLEVLVTEITITRNRRRLLHPGADTKLILSQYVATIKCLRVVDPPGVLLFKIADPIRRYLR